MEDEIFDISFTAAGNKYKGWVNPSDKLSDKGLPISFHVVIDQTSFGYLSYHHEKWIVNEERPAELTEAIGAEIERYYTYNREIVIGQQ